MRMLILFILVFIIPISSNADWEKCNAPKIGYISDIARIGEIYFGLGYTAIVISKDKGKTWEIQDNALYDVHIKRVIAIKNNLYYFPNKGMYVSRDSGKTVEYIKEVEINPYNNFVYSNSNDTVYYVYKGKLKYYFDNFTKNNEIFKNEDSIGCDNVFEYKNGLIAATNKGFYFVNKSNGNYKKIEGTEGYGLIQYFTFSDDYVFFADYKTLYITDINFKKISILKDNDNILSIFTSKNYLYICLYFGIIKYDIINKSFDNTIYFDNLSFSNIVQIDDEIFLMDYYHETIKFNILTNQFDIFVGYRNTYIEKIRKIKERTYGIIAGRLMYSDDEGLNWNFYDKNNLKILSLEIIDSLFFISKFHSDPDKFGTTLRSSNYGKDWNRMNNVEYAMPQYINEFLLDRGNLYMAGSIGVLVSKDSGLTWRFLDSTLTDPQDLFVLDSFLFALGPYGVSKVNINDNTIYKISGGDNLCYKHIFQMQDTLIIYEDFWSQYFYLKSTDRGKTFTYLTGGFKTPSYKLYSDKHKLSIIDSVLCFSFDNGVTWVNLLELSVKDQFSSYIITDKYIYGNHPDGILRKKLSEFSTTDVVESEYNNDNVIFPNPATDYIKIDLERCATLQKCGTSEVEIYDVMGVLIQTTPSASQPPLHEGNLKIDVSNLAPGVYFLKIGDMVEKFVKYVK